MKKFYCVLLVLLLSGLSWAVVEYGQLAGVVTDNKGVPLPGATITLESEAMIGGSRTALSDATGEFIFIQLRPGDYTVTCAMEGFQSVKNEKVKVNLDRTTKIIVKLQAAKEFQETVVVTGQAPVVDPTQTNTGDVFDETYLQETAIGSGGRSYQSVLTQTGGVTGAGNVSVFGSTGTENNYLIDGLSTTDPVTSTFGTNFNFDAIQEISFQTGGYEAEYGQATGGIVNVVTKSGSNTFEGAFDIRYSNQRFYEGSSKYPPWSPYDPSKDTTSFYNPAFSLGGPLMKDKIWFFISVQDEQAKTTPAGVDYSYKWDGQNYMGKITWQLSPSDTLIGKYSQDPAKIHNFNAGISTAKIAGGRQDQGGDIWQGDYSRILSDSLLLSVKLGVNRQNLDAYPESGDLTSPPYYDLTRKYSYGNYGNAQFSNRDRTEGLFSLTWFKNNFAGDHTVKVGGEYHDVSFDYNSFTPGDRSYYTYNYDPSTGTFDPFFKYVYQRVPPYTDKGKQWTTYLQDEWKILPNLVLKPGVRYDQAEYSNEIGKQVVNFHKWQPRVGFAWDVFNNAKTLFRGFYGTFMHPAALTLPDVLRANGTSYTRWNYRGPEYCAEFGGCDSEYYDEGTTYSFDAPQVSPNLGPSYAKQWNVGIEHEFAPRTSLELSYVQKRTENLFDDTCYGYDASGNPIDPFNFVGSPDLVDSYKYPSNCQFYMLRNIPAAKRYYFGYILKFESRYKDWFHVILDYTYSKAYESMNETQYQNTDFDLPIMYINAYGYAPSDNRSYVKLNGYFYLPYKITMGFNGFFRTGRPYVKYCDKYCSDGDTPGSGVNDYYSPPQYGYLNLETPGAHRLGSVWWIDYQISWGIKISGNIQAKFIGSINNLTNNQAVLGRCSYWTSTNPNEEGAGYHSCGYAVNKDGTPYWLSFGDAYAWQSPRSYEVGFRLEF